MSPIRWPGSLTCLMCGKPIRGSYLSDWNGNAVCADHTADTIPRCVSCHRFCDPRQSTPLSHGAYLCPICCSDVVNRQTAAAIVSYIRRAYIKAGLGEIKNWRLKVTDLDTMYNRHGNINVRGYASIFCGNYELYVLRHLSRVAFANVLAHELLHIWQFNHHLDPIPPLCEGFCNMGSYYVLQHIGNDEAHAFMAMHENNTDPVYGNGFRIVKAAYDHGGWDEARTLLTNK